MWRSNHAFRRRLRDDIIKAGEAVRASTVEVVGASGALLGKWGCSVPDMSPANDNAPEISWVG